MWSWTQDVHTHTHTQCSLSRLISLPIITPPIWHQPARSIMADNSVSLQAGLSISISPPLISYFVCISLFHTISPLSLSQPPHTTLSCLQTVSVSKLLKSYAYPILLCFLALLSQKLSLHLPPTKSRYLTLTNLLLTPLWVPQHISLTHVSSFCHCDRHINHLVFPFVADLLSAPL